MENREIDLTKPGTKARSKHELYQLLTSHCNLYLPPYKYCTVNFCADVLNGSKLALECDKVIVKKIPQMKGLRTEDLVSFCISECEGEKYLPDKLEKRPPDREWILNICNSLDSFKFNNFINSVLQFRESKIQHNKNLTLSIPSKLADAIESSNYISTSKGRSNLLLNRNKRFARLEKEATLAEERSKDKRKIDSLENEIAFLEEELKHQREHKNEADKNREILKRLYDDRVIDEEGNLL